MNKPSMTLTLSLLAVTLAGCANLEEGIAEETADTYYATLTGAQVVGGGDPDGAIRGQLGS